MLTFTAPLLWPLLALLVPLAIHLWNRRPGREVAVGSLRWLTAGTSQRLRQVRLAHWPLLVLRLLLLAGLAGALAGPAWQPRHPLGHGQVLVSPALAGSPALAAERPRLDSLRRRGYGLRWLAPGLPAIGRAAWQADSAGAPPDSILLKDNLLAAPDFYAERIRLAADSLAGQPLLVLTPATLRGNSGTRQPLPAGVTWRALPLATETTWLQAATASGDSLRLLLGHGTENQVAFRLRSVPAPRVGAVLATEAGQWRYQGTGGLRPLGPPDTGAVRVPPAALRVWVVAPAAHAAEGRILRAALRAASLGLPGPLQLTVAATPPDTAQAPDWLFWLADQPAPVSWRGAVRRGLRLWQFPVAAGQPDTAHLALPALAAPVAVWRRAPVPTLPNAAPLWPDGLGRPLLAQAPLGHGAYYYCATRLAPTWSELADSPDLPALLLEALHPAFDATGQQRLLAHDPRRLDPAQLLPALGHRAKRQPASAFSQPVALGPWLVLALAVLFGLERWLAARRAGAAATTLLAPN